MRSMLRGKIHRATVTGADLEYEGSISIDETLMDAAGIAEWEHVHVLDVTNGARLETYVIVAPAGSGEIRINGAAAHLVHPGDKVIIVNYETVPTDQIADHHPALVHVDEQNRIVKSPTSSAVSAEV
jgi:aspartate 1-decarboxylase